MRAFRKWAVVAASTAIAGVAFTGLAFPQQARAAESSPATTLGIYTTDEDNTGQYPTSWPDNQQPDVANTYLAWGQPWPSAFVNAAVADGATPFIEIEPWEGGPSFNQTPQFSNIAANGDSADSYCGANNNTNCATWLASLGTSAKAAGVPVIFTFAHEFNVSGQYPWAAGDTGSCGSASCTSAQWIAAWNKVRSTVDASAAGDASFMWVPNAYNGDGGTVVNPSTYWPGASNVDMVGVDGYPQSQYGQLNFSTTLGTTYNLIQGLSGESTIAQPKIYLAETNLATLGSGSYESIPNWISDMCSAGGDGFLEFDDANWGLPSMTNAQWSQADAALASDCSSGGGTTPPPTSHAPVVNTSAATAVTTTTATLNGTVNPEGLSTTYTFDGGLDTSYGNQQPSPQATVGSGTSPVSESTTITGLDPSTTYHVRIEATNSQGTTYGSDVTFTTASGSGCQSGSAPSASPSNIQANVQGSWVQLTWGAAGNATQYEVQVALPNGQLWHDSTVGSPSATYSPVPTTGTYHYKVRSQNCAGDGPWSVVKAFTVTS
jgi:beta-mannanase